MKHPLPQIIVAFFLVVCMSQAQRRGDSIPPLRPKPLPTRSPAIDARLPGQTHPLARFRYPLAAKFSFSGGIGVEYAVRDDIALELNTMFVAHSAKARYFLLNGDVSPFVSAGLGLASERFVSPGVSGYWIETQVGVERALDRGFMRVQLHYTIDQTENLGWPQFTPDFTLGYRF